jgi:peptidoglycan/LPS O-acetylase OafA/YrhL
LPCHKWLPLFPNNVTTSSGRKRTIPTLDGWRAIAISLVIIHHAGTAFYPSAEDYFSRAITRFGVNGVPIFFALSGLLICKLLLEEADANGSIALRAFYIRRCFRILPPLFAFLVVAYVAGCIVRPLELWSSVLFFRNYVPSAAGSVYSEHLWSLSVEEHFYLLWPGLLCWLLTTKRPALYTAVLAFGLEVWRTIDLHLHLIAKMLPFLDVPWRTDFRLDALLWGCVAAFLLQEPKYRALCLKISPLIFASIVGFYLLCLTVPVPMRAVWAPMAIPLMLVGTLTHEYWWFSRMLDFAPIRWIGRISYSLYLWQQLFFVPHWEMHTLPHLQRLPLNIGITLVCATASYYLIEKPFIRMGRRVVLSYLPLGPRLRAVREG